VVRVDNKSIKELAVELQARKGPMPQDRPEEFQATFTITNAGASGMDRADHQPLQVAILGLGQDGLPAVVRGERPAPRLITPVAVHRSPG
jgi:pyruvate/2-oxoglutarate dehydrogenase complex dihydrolipoamide acyltransferase (E2) component